MRVIQQIQKAVIEDFCPAKTCPKCGIRKQVVEFYKNIKRSDGLYGYCKKCSDLQSASWKKRNRSAVTAMNLRATERDPHRHRRQRIKSDYGLSIEAYEKMLIAQGGKCAMPSCEKPLRSIFGEKSTDRRSLACIDHDHVSGRVRGLLCNRCNYVVGCVEKHGHIIGDAKDYLGAKSC